MELEGKLKEPEFGGRVPFELTKVTSGTEGLRLGCIPEIGCKFFPPPVDSGVLELTKVTGEGNFRSYCDPPNCDPLGCEPNSRYKC
ncbi:MAG: hypothetical protein AABX37_04085 [Nanoarchaeota archaeon]